jgi:hypothetical protein
MGGHTIDGNKSEASCRRSGKPEDSAFGAFRKACRSGDLIPLINSYTAFIHIEYLERMQNINVELSSSIIPNQERE